MAPQTLEPNDSVFAYPAWLLEAGLHPWYVGVTYTPEGGGSSTRYAPGTVFVQP